MAAVGRDKTKIAPLDVVQTTKTYRESPLLVAVEVGQQLKQVSNGWRLTAPGEYSDGMSMKDGSAGKVGHDILLQGEMAGFTGITQGTELYPSASLNGELNTTAVSGFRAQVKCCRAGWIRVNYTRN